MYCTRLLQKKYYIYLCLTIAIRIYSDDKDVNKFCLIYNVPLARAIAPIQSINLLPKIVFFNILITQIL